MRGYIMERSIMWTPWSEPGLEYLHLLQKDEKVIADSVIIGISNRTPFRLWYEMVCNTDWTIKEWGLILLGGNGKSIKMQPDGQGHWSTISGAPLPSLEGCIDVDISATPFTNTLPIRRLALSPGQSVELLVAYVVIPELELKPDRQRYTCLGLCTQEALYKYEALESAFIPELPVYSIRLLLVFH